MNKGCKIAFSTGPPTIRYKMLPEIQVTWGLPPLKHTSCQQLLEQCHLPGVKKKTKTQPNNKQIKLILKIEFSLAPVVTEVIAQEGAPAAPLTAGIHSEQAINLLFNMTDVATLLQNSLLKHGWNY